MNPCRACGQKVRLGALRVSFNRKRGVVHFVKHYGKGCDASKEYDCTTWKSDKVRPKPWELLISRWNTNNPPADLSLIT